MIPLRAMIEIRRGSTVPVYLQITNSLVQAIRRGQIRRGVKLPGSRELAKVLRVHRRTLQNAYDELMAQGWIEILPRRGAFVARQLPEIKPMTARPAAQSSAYPDVPKFDVDMKLVPDFPVSSSNESGDLVIDDGLPDVRLAPIRELLREYRGLSERNAFHKYFRYGGPEGSSFLIETLTAFLSETRGLPVSNGNIMITRGAQMAFFLAASVLLHPGDTVVVGEPGYFIMNATLRHFGASLSSIPVDASGIDVEAIECLCRRKPVKMIYVISHHHYPTTVTLTPERRIRLLELAARYKFAVIEDDYDYDFDYGNAPVLPMASLDHDGNVIYVGTLTKTLVPAIRVGFMVAPEKFIQAASQLRRAIDWQGDTMMESAIAGLYQNGTIGRHIRKSVSTYRARRDTFCDLLAKRIGKHITYSVPGGGMAVWVRFNDVDLKQLSLKARREGLAMGDGSLYDTRNRKLNSTRLGFASLNAREQSKAIEILESCL